MSQLSLEDQHSKLDKVFKGHILMKSISLQAEMSGSLEQDHIRVAPDMVWSHEWSQT
jgi:hypothetical protein